MSNINLLLYSVPKLSRSNYHDWKFAIQMVLWRAGSWEIISRVTKKLATEAEEWVKLKADEGLSFIGLMINATQYSYIHDTSNRVEAWQALKDIYEKNSHATCIMLKWQFYGYQHDKSRPIADYISGVSNLAAQWTSGWKWLGNKQWWDICCYSWWDGAREAKVKTKYAILWILATQWWWWCYIPIFWHSKPVGILCSFALRSEEHTSELQSP